MVSVSIAPPRSAVRVLRTRLPAGTITASLVLGILIAMAIAPQFFAHADPLASLDKAWARSHNLYARRPAEHDSLPLQTDESVESDPLESTDWRHPAFARPRTGASTAGKGGDLTKYPGARPPNGDVDDWITRWQRHPAAARR